MRADVHVCLHVAYVSSCRYVTENFYIIIILPPQPRTTWPIVPMTGPVYAITTSVLLQRLPVVDQVSRGSQANDPEGT